MKRDGHWSWRTLAAASGYTSEYLRLAAAGHYRPSPRTIRALADALDVPYSVLAPSPRTDASLRVLHAVLGEIEAYRSDPAPARELDEPAGAA